MVIAHSALLLFCLLTCFLLERNEMFSGFSVVRKVAIHESTN